MAGNDIPGAKGLNLNNVTISAGNSLSTNIKGPVRVSGSTSTYKPVQLNNTTIQTMDTDKYLASSGTNFKTFKGELGSYTLTIPGNRWYSTSILSKSFNICNTKSNIYVFLEYIKKSKLYQEQREGSCLQFAYAYAWGLYVDKRDFKTKDIKSNELAGKFSKYVDSDINNIMEIIYCEITNGRPVVLQVNGDKGGTKRHYVTVVGFNSSIASGSQLRPESLLVIDTYDGIAERMDLPGSRFVTTGEDCGRDYDGYCIYFLKQNSSSSNVA